MAPSAIIALCLLALTSAAPHTLGIQCSTSCNPSPKFSYAAGVTYAYQYTGHQAISLEGVEEGSSNAEWSANVALTWITPCDVAISVQNVAGSTIPDIQESGIEKYPLVLAVNNGIVESVCSHPEDFASSINVKKAIASALQNALPSIVPTSETQVITETDVVGTCPTKYTITTEGGKTMVTKEKIHSECQEHFYDQTKISVLPSATPLPMHDSRSSCRQEITNGIYSTIACKDTKVITPGYGIFKYVKAIQDFTLQYVSESDDMSAISSHQGVPLMIQTLKHGHGKPFKNPSIVPRVDAIMTEICTLSQGQSNKEVASLVAQVIELLRFVPDDAIVEVLDKIRDGQYCDDYTKLESLYLDALAFVGEPGAFYAMALEIAAGRTTGGRLSLYTVAVNLLTQPTDIHVFALSPIFGMADSNQLISLAASTVFNRYCTQNSDCDQNEDVMRILDVLSAKLDTQCTPDFSNVETKQVLTTLKTVGNIGKATTRLFDSVMKCALTEGIETNVRFAAALSLKGVTCLEPVTQGLKSVALDTTMNTEVRIGSYLAAVRCANAGDLQDVIDQMTSESNKQVQGFILSHLANLQETNWPLKQTLQEILSTKNIPDDYMSNIFKYSRNIEMSYNTPIVEVGGLVESNIVYSPESYVPRLVNLGLNMNLLGSFLNIGEVGARVEGLDPYFEDALGPNSYLYKEVFGPDSYLYKTPIWTIVEDSKLFVTKTGTEFIQLVKDLIKENNINIDVIVYELNKLMTMSKNINLETLIKTIKQMIKEYKNIDVQALLKSVDFDSIIKNIDVQALLKSVDFDSIIKNIDVQALLKSVDIDPIINAVVKFLKNKNIQIPRTDLYAILRGQERAFLSFGGEQNKFTVKELVETITPVIMDAILSTKDINIDTTRIGQINFDYSIPTISGIPLKVKLTGTAIAGIKINNNLNAKKSAIDALLKIMPSLNTQVEAQIGFGEILNTGLKLRNTAYTTNGFSLSVVQKNEEDLELRLKLPEKMELFDIQSEVFLMNLDKASNEVKLFPSKMQDMRIVSNQCTGIMEPVTGLLVCYNMNVPDLLNSDSLPLGQPMMFRVYLQRSDIALKGYRLVTKLRNKPEKKILKIVAGTYGAANSKESTLKLSYTREGETHFMAFNIQSTFIMSTTKITFINQPENLSLQIYCNDKFSYFAPVEGSVKFEFKSVTEDNGQTYEVATYAGLTKSLYNKHRIFTNKLSILESGDMITAYFYTGPDLLPVNFQVEVDIPKNAGLRIYKVEKIIVRSTVSSFVVESSFLRKSPEEFQTTMLVLNSGYALINIDVVHTISIDSPIFGGTANKINLMTLVTGKLPFAEFGIGSELKYENGVMTFVIGDPEVLEFNSKLTYNNGALEASSGIKYYTSEVALVNSKLTYNNGALEASSGIKYYNSEVALVNSKLSYNNGALEASSGIKYYNSEVVLVNSKLTYNNGVLETSSGIKYYNSELALLKSKLSYNNGAVEFTSGATYLDATIFSAKLKQTLDIQKLAFMAEIEVPKVQFSIRSKWSYSKMAFESFNVAKYSGSNILGIFSKIRYANGMIELKYKIKHQRLELFIFNVRQSVAKLPFNFKAEVFIRSVLNVNFQQTIDNTALTTVAEIDIPNGERPRKPLKINHVFGIKSAFSYSILTDVNWGGSVLLHVEGPLNFVFSRTLVQQNLNLKISGPFDGTFKIIHGITLSFEKMQYTIDMKHTNTPIVFIDLVLDISNYKDISVKSTVNLPFVIESDMAATITTTLIHSTMNILALPSTPYARRFKGYTEFNWVENNFKSDFYWDAERDNDKKIGFTTKYALDTTAFKFIIQGDLVVTTVNYGYMLESVLASPFDGFQGVSGLELTVTMPSKKIAVAKFNLDIQYVGIWYAASEVTLKPTIAFITTNDKKYELTTSVVKKTPSTCLNTAITSETTLSTPQLQQITFVTSLILEDKSQSGKIAFKMALEESVLSEAMLFEYILQSDLFEFLTMVKVQKGSNVRTLSTVISLESGVTTSLALTNNQEIITKVYYSMPSFTSHIVGIEFPSRTLEYSAEFVRNKVTFKIFPDKKNSAKLIETTLRFIKKAGTGQFEVLLAAPSLSKEMRFAVELELIEPGNDKYDMISIDIQYQVSEAPKLLRATIKELKNIYIDLVNDGMCPDLNKWYREVQNVFKQIPKFLNSISDELSISIPKYYEFVKTYFMNLFELHKADIIAMWNTIHTELLRYWNIVKTETPIHFNKYIDILKKTKMWNIIQTTVSQVLANYPAYYDAAVDFYNKVIITYVAELTDMVGKILVLPEFDVSQYVPILKNKVSSIVKNVVSQLLDTEIVKMLQEKLFELKTVYPTEFSLMEDIYTNVILPTSTEVLAIVNKILAIPDLDYQKYWNVIISDIPELSYKLSQRILDTQIVNKLRGAFPTLFINTEDIYSNVILPTMKNMEVFIRKVATLPVDFQEYWAITKVDVPVIVSQFIQCVLDTQMVKDLKESFPIVFEISEDFYRKVIFPTVEDIFVLAEKLITFPVVDFQETFKQYWDFIKAEALPLFKKFIQRFPDTKLVQMLNTLYPMVFEVSVDFYRRLIVPTASDVVIVVDKLVTIPLYGIQRAVKQSWNILKVEIPTLMGKFFERLPETLIAKLIKEKSTELLQLLQEKLSELKTQYPVEYATAIDFYNKVAVPAYSDLIVIYGKLSKISDVYEIRDLLKSEVMMFLNNLLKNIGTTELMNIVISKFNELVALYPEEYQAVLTIYNQVSQITLRNILVAVKSYTNEELGITYSISTGKFTAVVPLPVSVATVRNYYHIITVYAPAYVADVVAQGLAQGLVLYKYIAARMPAIGDYIYTKQIIYLQYTMNFLEKLPIIIPEYLENVMENVEEFIEKSYDSVEEILTTAETYIEFAMNSIYVEEMILLVETKFKEIMILYPVESAAIMEFLFDYMFIAFDYIDWVFEMIFDDTVEDYIEGAIDTIGEYLDALIPETAQSPLDLVMEYVTSTLNFMKECQKNVTNMWNLCIFIPLLELNLHNYIPDVIEYFFNQCAIPVYIKCAFRYAFYDNVCQFYL